MELTNLALQHTEAGIQRVAWPAVVAIARAGERRRSPRTTSGTDGYPVPQAGVRLHDQPPGVVG